MAITPLPTPPNRNMAEDVFVETADSFLAALPVFASEADAAAIAMNNNSTNSTSTTSLSIGTGTRVPTVQTAKSYVEGQTLKIARTSSPANWMVGEVTSYVTGTGVLTIEVREILGSGGPFTDWTISLAPSTDAGGSLTQDFAVKSLTGAVSSDVASTATIDLDAAGGNSGKITGSAAITAVTLANGKKFFAYFPTGGTVLTHHTTNCFVNAGGANVIIGAGDHVLFSAVAGVRYADVVRATGLSTVPATILSGAILQQVHTQSTANTTDTNTIPIDSTIPQNTEGSEFLAATIIPTNTNNKLVINVVMSLANSSASEYMIVALFQDATASALAAQLHFQNTSGSATNVALRYEMTAGTTSSTTFKIRCGQGSAGTCTMNVALLGAVTVSSITVTEHKV